MRRGEIYFIDLEPIVGREQGGHRPVLVVSSDRVNSRPLTVTVVPGTDGANVRWNYPHSVRVPAAAAGLPMETVFMAFQIRSVDPSRFAGPPDAVLPREWMVKVEAALRYTLEL